MYCDHMKGIDRAAHRLMRDQLSLITRRQAVALGMSPREVRHRVATGHWTLVHPGVYRAASAGRSPERDLLAACLGAGTEAAASHRSAAWLLGLCPAPDRAVITVPHRFAVSLSGVAVHRSRDLDPGRTLVRNGIPYTDALRVLSDLAAELEAAELSELVDRALARRLVTTDGLLAEIARRSRPGLSGPGRLKRVLVSRGFVGAPEPSVLEALAMRLFHRWGIPVLGREVKVGGDGRYRIDFLIAPSLVVEVDGFAHHWSPEDKAYDDARRNRLRAEGLTVLVYDWRSVRLEERRIVSEVRHAMAGATA